MEFPKVFKEYKKVAIEMLQYSFPGITYEECELAVDFSILKRYQDTNIKVTNNYKKIETETTLMAMAEYILTREPIITMHGVMFKKHAESENPLGLMMQNFMESRDDLKAQMFQHPKGSDEYEKYNLLQLLTKIDTNGIYGALGQYSCMFYNIYVAASITAQGRACISAAGLQFEMFLANNVKFMYFDEILTYIHNVTNEKRKFKDSEFLDRDITAKECFYKIMMTCGFIPDNKQCNIIADIISQLTQENLNRLYYKNNLYEFCRNSSMVKAIQIILARLKWPFANPNKPPKEISVELDTFAEILMEYIYYPHQIIDKYEKFRYMTKSVIIIQDTDSCIVSLDAWFRFCIEVTDGVEMDIKKNYYNPIEMIENFDDVDGYHTDPDTGEVYYKPIEIIDQDYDYDFYDDEMVEIEHAISPITMIPQDNFRHSAINIIAYTLGRVINDYMIETTKNFNSYAEGKKCLLIMKNEFLFKRLLSLNVKKNYASIIELQEGKSVPEKSSLDIKGMSIDKSTLNDTSRQKLKEILYEDILKPDNIDQIAVLKDLAIMEKNIFNSLATGEKKYYKPATIKSMNAYANPMQIQGIKAAVVWNAVKGNAEGIDLTKRNAISIVKVVIDHKTIQQVQESNPDIYEILKELLSQKEFAPTITTVAVPNDITAPAWLLKFIDYTQIINDNLKNFPLECIGIHKGKDSVNKTNILQL